MHTHVEEFVSTHKDTKLIVIDTFQKIRNISNDNAYANDYRDISLLKSIADKLEIAILLIHHLRKQKDDDPVNMVSGTTGITGAVDSSFVLDKSKRSSDKAVLYCTGRDIEYRELTLEFKSDTKVWEMITDSVDNPEILLDDIVSTVVTFMKNENFFEGTPAELAERLSKIKGEDISPIVLSKRLNQNISELKKFGVEYKSKRSNGKRIIILSGFPETSNEQCEVLNSAGSDGNLYMPTTDPADPVNVET